MQRGEQSASPTSVALGAGLPLVTGGMMLLAASALTGEAAPRGIEALSRGALWALAYLIVFGSIVGFSAYAWLLRVAPASRVASHAYVNPLVAVALGWSVGGEPMTTATGIAAGVIAASVAMIVCGR
jgi:drug/metabolite transporter (DMT)-like permease